MNRIFLLTASVMAAAAGRAAAADLLSAPPAPSPPPAFSWTGVYVGANVGYSWGANDRIASHGAVVFDNDPLFGATSALGATGVEAPNFNGAFGGGQIGYNRQLSSRLVLGAEADVQTFAVQGAETRFSALTPPNLPRYSITTVTQASRNVDYLGTFRGRLGFAIRPEALLYVTGGLAYGRVSQTVTQVQTAYWSGSPRFPADSDPFGFASNAFADSRAGWTAGGGVEWAFRGNWSAKVEYLYYDLGRVHSASLLGFDTNAIPGPGSGGTGLVAIETTTRFNGHLLRAGLNYRLDLFRPSVLETE